MTYTSKNKNTNKREMCKQIITYYPKQKYAMDLTELTKELCESNKIYYLYNLIW